MGASAELGSAAPRGASPTGGPVLVVDDDVDIVEVMTMALEAAGYSVLSAHSGIDALTLLRGGARPCVILLDLMMPTMNGWEFRAEQMRDPELASLPVVVLTGDGHVEQKAAALGVSTFLKKPVELDTLLETVKRHQP